MPSDDQFSQCTPTLSMSSTASSHALIQPQIGVQPPYIAINPAPHRTSLARLTIAPSLANSDGTKDRRAGGRHERGESAPPRRRESRPWLKDDMLDKSPPFVNSKGEQVRAQPKDVAILFRKLTDIYDYLEPLRRSGIRYVVEGERHFYAAKEIIDAVNLLRADRESSRPAGPRRRAPLTSRRADGSKHL